MIAISIKLKVAPVRSDARMIPNVSPPVHA
jgi:hypothetical protein